MGHLKLVDTRPMGRDDFVTTIDTIQPEAASAVSEFGHEDKPQAKTVTRWTRIKRAVRTWWLWRFAKP